MEHATLRVAPNSTYKIYDALFGLEEEIITPENSFIAWNGETYPFEAWNADQTLQSAMNSSVNWYFESVDEQLGAANISNYIQEIGYGNENISGDFSTYWMESSLKISPIEQVELLTQLQNNNFGFAPENINAVKDSICLSSSDAGTFYGKTGTGRVDGQDVYKRQLKISIERCLNNSHIRQGIFYFFRQLFALCQINNLCFFIIKAVCKQQDFKCRTVCIGIYPAFD